jgi:outer membrane protein TolC
MTPALLALAALLSAAPPAPAQALQAQPEPPATALQAQPAPLTLDDALAVAARDSHDLAIARADAGLAGADTLSAFAGLLPRLDFTTTAGRQFTGDTKGVQLVQAVDPVSGALTFQQQVVPVPATSFESYTLGLKLAQPLVDLPAWRQTTQARAAERAAARSYDETRLGVAFEVTRRFYEQLRATRTLTVLEKAARRSEELVERADALYAAGRAQKADTFAARVNLGNDRMAVEQARARLSVARADLATSLGRPGDAALQVTAPPGLEGPIPAAAEPPPLPELLAAARQRRPSVAAVAAQVEAADAALGVARGAYLPRLSAELSYGRSGTQLAGSDGVYGDPSRQYAATAQLVLGWNLFAGRATEAAEQRARLGADRARASAARTLDGVAHELTTAREAVVTQARQVGLAADNLTAAEQGLALARQRLEAGLASQLEVRDATLKLTQAELSLVQARIDHAVAAADLNRAVGGAL